MKEIKLLCDIFMANLIAMVISGGLTLFCLKFLGMTIVLAAFSIILLLFGIALKLQEEIRKGFEK